MSFARLKELRDREAKRLKAWYVRYERLLVSSFLIGGFLLDFFTSRALNIETTLAVLGIHLVFVVATILYVFWFDDPATASRHPLWGRLRTAAPLLTQLSFGSLLSMSFLFYWFSGSVSVSWPIFSMLVFFIVFNEAFRHAYLRPTVQVSVFAFVAFSFSSILFPHLFNSLDASVVLFAGAASFLVSLGLVFSLILFAPRLRRIQWKMVIGVCSVFILMSALYLMNVLPPIPLSLREAGLYYRVQRAGDGYSLVGEPSSFWQSIFSEKRLFQTKGDRVYAFTAVYSPADLNTRIYHVWEWYNEEEGRWIKKDRLSFSVIGGRREGYRGYTFKTNLVSGKWRVTIETEREQVLGRLLFFYTGSDQGP